MLAVIKAVIMINVTPCLGQEGRIGLDGDDGFFTGRLAGIRAELGSMPIRLNVCTAGREAVEDYLETCAKVGKTG